jgi:hypothetical protein
MKKNLLILVMLTCFIIMSSCYCLAEEAKVNILLLIAEQNIEGPQRAWWASEIDLSAVEARLAKVLIAQGYNILAPSQVAGVLLKEKAFRRVNISEAKSIKLAKLTRANYVILGKALASSGGNIPSSNMRSCFANVTAKLIQVKDGRIIAYLEASGNSVHMDLVSGGREALIEAAEELAARIINALSQQGG